MTRAARWTSSRGIALGIAAEYRIPRLDADDVRQEALVALWEATGSFDAARGSWPGFARLVVHRHLTDMLRAATTIARRAPTVELDPERDEDRTVRDRMEYRLELLDVARRLPTLTKLERASIIRVAAGVPYGRDRSVDSAVQRARHKLRSAA